MTTSSIGNKLPRVKPALRNFRQGFTFIEIMTTLAILAGGVIMLYKAFFLCLDYQTHLIYRTHAHNILENKIALTEQMLRDYKVLSFDHDVQEESVEFNGRPVTYHIDIQIAPAGDAMSLYQIEIAVAWRENKRDVTIRRSAFISSITSIRQT